MGELVEARLIVESTIDSPKRFDFRQPLQRLIDGIPRGEIDEIARRLRLGRRVRTDALKYGCL